MINLVMAREPFPSSGPSVFLAGPTPRAGGPVESWRPDALAELDRQWVSDLTLTVYSPESRGGIRAEHYDDQVGWETAARQRADVVLFWIPRDEEHMPGFTTNVEYGMDVVKHRVVLGCPPDCPSPQRNRYLQWVGRSHGVPVRATLAETVAAAVEITAARYGADGRLRKDPYLLAQAAVCQLHLLADAISTGAVDRRDTVAAVRAVGLPDVIDAVLGGLGGVVRTPVQAESDPMSEDDPMGLASKVILEALNCRRAECTPDQHHKFVQENLQIAADQINQPSA
ncbi:nucleoside 2-deoxyribosyltransferase domain-containing protein [Kitasatospora griseola]|uniref:nucleoside 2-deoxyribosyltransferase domain-containing protein n=1 Tax=Kitasatospora griseola TaxID=2064 RepID=UPI0034394FF4